MTDLKEFLHKTHKNLQFLQEREAKYAGNTPVELLNQIDDHRQAIELTEQAMVGELDEAAWREQLKPLLVSIDKTTPERHISTEGGAYFEGKVQTDSGDVVARDKVTTTIIINNYPPPVSEQTKAGSRFLVDESIPDNPYRGLFAFRPEHAHLFFGRETFTQKLVQATESRSLVAVLGASGSGKSSVVFAGLVPALDTTGKWQFTTFRPGDDPFFGLGTALVPLIDPDLSKIKQTDEARDFATRLREGRSLLPDHLKTIRDNNPDQHLLIIADQFEELYTLCPDADTRQRFLDVLLDTVEEDKASSSCLVITLRADFLSQASLYRPFADALQGTTKLIGPMTREELAQAIEKPAQLQGIQFEKKLVSRILDDLGEEEGSLPLLEFALTELWQYQQQRILTHISYEEIGQATGALSAHADQVYQRLTAAEQEQARRIFVQLVAPGTGTEDTRRLASREELTADWNLVAKLASERLVVTNQVENEPDTVEVVHEALIRHWTQLRVWMDEDREFRAWQQGLRASLGQWQMLDHDEGILLRGAALTVATEQLANRQPDLAQTEQAFIQSSLARQEREVVDQEIQRRRIIGAIGAIVMLIIAFLVFGIWNAQQNAQQQEIAAQTAQALQQAEGIALATATYALGEANRQGTAVAEQAAIAVAAEETAKAERAEAIRLQAEAINQSRISLAKSLAALAPRIVQHNNDTELAALLALEAKNLNRDERGHIQGLVDSSLRDVLSGPNFNTVLRGNQDSFSSVAFSPDGNTLASGSSDTTIRLWNLTDLAAEPVILKGHRFSVRSVAFSPDGNALAFGSSDDATIRLWDLTDPTAEPVLLSGHGFSVSSVAFSPDGNALAFGSSDDATIRLWDLTDPAAEPVLLSGHQEGVWSVAFSPDGNSLVSGSEDATIRLWIPWIETLADLACQQVHRNLTQAEWARYLPGEEYRQTCENLPLGK